MRYSFCESTFAGPRSAWHIRSLTAAGPMLGGNIDTAGLCGWPEAHHGWDLQAPLTPHHLEVNACKVCARLYREAKQSEAA